MYYEIRLDEEREIVHGRMLTASGDGTFLPQLVRAGRRPGWHRFLVQYTVPLEESDMDLFDITAGAADLGFDRSDQVAIVTTSATRGEWVELVAGNRGWNLRAFATVPEAEAWLVSLSR